MFLILFGREDGQEEQAGERRLYCIETFCGLDWTGQDNQEEEK